MAYPGFGAYGGYSGQMPGMQMTVGQPIPGAVPNMPHGGYSGYSAYSGTYSAAADPMWTYFAAIAGQGEYTFTPEVRGT